MYYILHTSTVSICAAVKTTCIVVSTEKDIDVDFQVHIFQVDPLGFFVSHLCYIGK